VPCNLKVQSFKKGKKRDTSCKVPAVIKLIRVPFLVKRCIVVLLLFKVILGSGRVATVSVRRLLCSSQASRGTPRVGRRGSWPANCNCGRPVRWRLVDNYTYQENWIRYSQARKKERILQCHESIL